jgi:hypothetical protein
MYRISASFLVWQYGFSSIFNCVGLMTKQLIAFLFLVIGAPVFSASSHSVKGYTKKDGTYVQSHKKTNPDQIRRNNYSSEGNYNPNTGKQGKQRNELSNPPKYNDSYNDGQGKRLNQLYGNPTK